MAKKKKGWMQRGINSTQAAKKKALKLKMMADFCPKCAKPKDPRRAILRDYARPDRCKHADCPLKDHTAPKDAKDRMAFHVGGGKLVYGPTSGPFEVSGGKIKLLGWSTSIKKKNEAWLEAQKVKKNPVEASDG